MAWVRKLASGRYQACWRDADHRERSETFRTKKEADARAIQVEHAKNMGGAAIDPRVGRESLGSYWREWIAVAERVGRPAPSTLAKYRWVWKHVEPALGSKALNAIRRSDVEAVVAEVTGRVSVFQGAEVLKLVRSLLGRAVADERIGRNVAAGLQAPRLPEPRPDVIEAVDVERIAAEMPERYQAIVTALAYTSLRWSELLALRSSDVDWMRRLIHVERKVVEVGATFHFGEPKTDRSRRTVHAPAVAIEAMARHIERYDAGPDGLIFASETGQPIRRAVFGRAWRPVVKRLGLEGFPVKNLRHVGATIAGEVSADPQLVRDRLGHSSLAMVSRVYQGVFDRRHREVADQMDVVARAAKSSLQPPRSELSGGRGGEGRARSIAKRS